MDASPSPWTWASFPAGWMAGSREGEGALSRCPNCGYQADADESDCPLCGSPLDGREEVGEASGRPAASGAAWDRAEGRFPEDFLRAWKESVFSPAAYFSALRPGGSLWRAILYYLVLSLLGAGLSVVWSLWLGGPGQAGGVYESLGLSTERIQLLLFLAAPFLALVFLAFFTLVYHFLVALLVEGRRGMRETARVLCYAWSGPQVFQAVPLVGGLIASVWSVVLLVVGIREMHGTSTGRAAAVALIPVFLFVVLPVLFVFALMLSTVGSGLPGI